MPILAGEIVTAARLNRMQPVPYEAVASAALNGPVTDTDITGASITLTTTAANAVYVARCFVDFDNDAAGTNFATVKLVVDSVAQSGQANYQQGVATDRATPGQSWKGTLASAGSHTLKLTGTLPAEVNINSGHTKLTVTIYEVV